MNRLNILVIILMIFFLVVLGIRFMQYQNIKYQETNRETVVEEEIENRAEEIPGEKEPIESPKQEEYEGDKEYGDSIMIF